MSDLKSWHNGLPDVCIDCDGMRTYPSGAPCLSCEATGWVLPGDGMPIKPMNDNPKPAQIQVLSEFQRKLDASVSEEQARESVRKEREREANRDKTEPWPRDGFINDYD